MELETLDKHIHLTEIPNGVEVMFAGQVCLQVVESNNGYYWKINSLFAKLTYGANVFEDIPYSFENHDTREAAIAEGLSVLYDMGAFYGALDVPEDTFSTEGGIENMTSESAEELDEAVTHQELLQGAQNAYIQATRQGNGVMAKHYGSEILKHKAAIAKQKTAVKQKNEELDTDVVDAILESIKLDCRKEAMLHSDSIMEAQDLAQGLFESFLVEAALSGDAYWKAKESEEKESKAKAERASMGIKEPVKAGRGKPTNIDRDLLHTKAKENVEAGKRPTAGFDRNEKIHFVRHLKSHPDFSEKHVSAAGRPTGTTKAAKVEKEVEKKKQASAFSMWSGLGKK